MPISTYTAEGQPLFRGSTLQVCAGVTALDGSGKTVPLLVGADGKPTLATGAATSAKQDTQIAAEQAIQSTLGATTGAAVVTDANGSAQQYLRGLVKLAGTSGIIVTGVATAAKQDTLLAAVATAAAQTTGNASLATIAAKDFATAAKQDTGNSAAQAIIPATTAAAVTPSDSTALTSRAVWVGGAGDLAVRLSGAPSTTVTFTAVPAGTLLPISVTRVMAATTATALNVLA